MNTNFYDEFVLFIIRVKVWLCAYHMFFDRYSIEWIYI